MSQSKGMTKMESHAGFLVLFLFLSLVHSAIGVSGRETVVVFQGDSTDLSYRDRDGKVTIRKPHFFPIPALVGGVFNSKEFLAIVCSARADDSSGLILVDGVARTSFGDHKQWTAPKIFTENTSMSETKRLLGDFTAVMKGKKIYVLAISFGSEYLTGESSDSEWEPFMFVGTVVDSTTSGVSGASIKWEPGKSLKNTIPKTVIETRGTHFTGGVSNGIVTKSGVIVFPIRLNQEGDLPSSSTLYSTDDGETWNIGGKTGDETTDGSVVEWGDGKLLFIVSSNGGYRKAYESDNLGNTWKESLMFSRVWGNEPNRVDRGSQGSAIKVPVDGKDVLLFAHPLNTKHGHIRDTLQLWLSDGQRIVRVGTISDESNEENTGNSILAHVGNKLYITHEINPMWLRGSSGAQPQQWHGVVAITSLPEFFNSAKTTVQAWRELDKKYKTKGIPTEGLVGFLGNAKRDNTVWADMYKCVDATVKGGKSVDGGFQFNGEPESGAEWPVASQGQNQVYIFTEKQFTLAATVIIHAAEEMGQFSLLGASLGSQGTRVHFGLGYTHDNKWYAVNYENEQITTSDVFKREKEYHVALTFANGVASVYVDDVDISDGKIKISFAASISHFYMGWNGQPSSAKATSAFTVKNVMLFNRALEQNEIAELAKITKDKKLHEEITTTELNRKSEGDTEVPTKQPGSGGEKKNSPATKKKANDGCGKSFK